MRLVVKRFRGEVKRSRKEGLGLEAFPALVFRPLVASLVGPGSFSLEH
jgi:hypothetical protein